MAASEIVIRGAREHNLRDVSLDLPHGRLICMTGVSGSGKSSLAFDTLFAEGQRRYVESLSSYARQFLGQMPKPDVDRIEGLSPTIAIQQKAGGNNPRSTVGTITEIYDFLRVLFARVGRGHCPQCGDPVAAQSREQIVAQILQARQGRPVLILAPVVRQQKGQFKDLFEEYRRQGYVRVRVDGDVHELDNPPSPARQVKHDIEIVIDRLKVATAQRDRLAEAVESALHVGQGALVVAPETRHAATNGRPEGINEPAHDASELKLSADFACLRCGISFEPPSPQLFSFNSPQGMCSGCDGLGERHQVVPDVLVPDPSKSVWDGAIAVIGPVKSMSETSKHVYECVANNLEADRDGPPPGSMLKAPWKDLDSTWRDAWLYGTGDRSIVYHYPGRKKHHSYVATWAGVVNLLLEKQKKRSGKGAPIARELAEAIRVGTCSMCGGGRINRQASAVRVGGRTLPELCAWPVGRLRVFFDRLAGRKAPPAPTADWSDAYQPEPLEPISALIAEELLKEIGARLGFLDDVGLHYLSLERSAPTLSGGEAQRIRLASQVGAGLVGVTYVLDEPSIGLHPRDNARLIQALQRLRDLGNTVVVVEHDEETMRAADLLVDFGPGPGVRGGQIVAAGPPEQVARSTKSLTGKYLSGRETIAVPEQRRPPGNTAIEVLGARHHNLKGIDVAFPLGNFIAVTGPSGSGKSSLVTDILREALAAQLNGADGQPGDHDAIRGMEHLDKVIDIDQSPIGRTPRSNPATYIKLFDLIRDLYAQLPESKARGYAPGRFSFNVEGGRCEACSGNGSNRLEMDFLADVWIPCPVCQGHRFTLETLQVTFKDKSISDVLEMDVQEALEHFANVPKIARMLQTLHDVGLDYIKLGQPSPTLSGGEAQRIKLARELVKRPTGRTLYILDEPTTGLHFADVHRLLTVLHGFVEQGNTVLVIEHNLDVIKTADWVIDLGPEGGEQGGRIVAEGPPEAIVKVPESLTGQALTPLLRCESSSSTTKPRSSKAKTRTNADAKAIVNGSATDTKTSKRGRNAPLTEIVIQKAQQHNLKGVDLVIPRDKMTVCCGPSGSGKTSLAIDTLYAEGQRRYVESLSSYARQFLAPLQKPRVEKVSGLSPAICIEQRNAAKSPRSTVGTVTEIYDYLRLLYARLGQPHCPTCQVPVSAQTLDQIVDRILETDAGERIYLLAPFATPTPDEDADPTVSPWEGLLLVGYARVRIDGTTYPLDEAPPIDSGSAERPDVEVVVDRLRVDPSIRARLADSVESALHLGQGTLVVARVDAELEESEWSTRTYSLDPRCESCGRGFEPLAPHHFSFNSPLGWCAECEGLGVQQGANPALLIPDTAKSLNQGAVAAWPELTASPVFRAAIQALGVDLDTPFEQLSPRQRRLLLHGGGDRLFDVPADPDAGRPAFRFQYKGLFPALEEAGRVSFVYRYKLQGLIGEVPCSACMGDRIRDDAAAVRFADQTLGELCAQPMGEVLATIKRLKLTAAQKKIAGELLREVRDRLTFLVDVGLHYLSLDRRSGTLSGGEAQRIRLASQIGSGLTGVLYVLDEPTIGLHPRDNDRLLQALRHLRDLGNTVVLVEHDRDIIEASDYLFDFGPGSGAGGGKITAKGAPADLIKRPRGLTAKYLTDREAIPVPSNRRDVDGSALQIRNARHHNLRGIDARVPLSAVTVVTGVSGSGKSSLVRDILWKAAAKALHRAGSAPGAHDGIDGLDQLDKVISVDQSPLGSSPHSTPATYTGLFDLIRELYARTPMASARGYSSRRFSFNQSGGRCEACEGMGQRKVEMHFLADVWVECEACQGMRYEPEILQITYRGKSIADVLALDVDGASELFQEVPKVRRILRTLADVGLGYLPLGQSAATLSGGEAQRVKLAAELARPDTGRTLYILDEPTTGLHLDDVRKLLEVIDRLADLGNTIVIIEHHLDVIKTADWILDLGPEAGSAGGELVASGRPEQVVRVRKSLTGQILKAVLERGPVRERKRAQRVDQATEDVDDALTTVNGTTSKSTDSRRKAGSSTNGQMRRPPEPETDAEPPWIVDGRGWHTRDCSTISGKPVRWDGQVLEHIIDTVQRLGTFAHTDWSRRTLVTIGGASRLRTHFLAAHTGNEWVLVLKFTVPSGAFDLDRLTEQLALEPFHRTRPPIPYDHPRIQLDMSSPGHYEVIIACHDLDEVKTQAFDDFLKRAVEQYLGQSRPENLGFASVDEVIQTKAKAKSKAKTPQTRRRTTKK